MFMIIDICDNRHVICEPLQYYCHTTRATTTAVTISLKNIVLLLHSHQHKIVITQMLSQQASSLSPSSASSSSSSSSL